MTRDELINSILVLDNVGMLDGIDLKELNDLELEKLHIEVENYAHKRIKSFMTDQQYSNYKEERELYKNKTNHRDQYLQLLQAKKIIKPKS